MVCYMLVILKLINVFVEAWEWDYKGPHGLGHWQEHFPACSKPDQSPINIPIYDLTSCPYLVTTFSGFHHKKSYTMMNNGHTAVVKVESSVFNVSVAVNTADKNADVYRTVQFHFHWGEDDGSGSEHTVGGEAFPLEVHFVNFNTKYSSIAEAMKQPDGLAVIAVLFEVSDKDNRHLNPLIAALKSVKNEGNLKLVMGQPFDSKGLQFGSSQIDLYINFAGEEATVENFSLTKLLPTKRDCFYRYHGSLTTPGCFESVTWTLFSEYNQISHKQVKMNDTSSYIAMLLPATLTSVLTYFLQLKKKFLCPLLTDILQTVSKATQHQLEAFRALKKDMIGLKPIGQNNRPTQIRHHRNVYANCGDQSAPILRWFDKWQNTW